MKFSKILFAFLVFVGIFSVFEPSTSYAYSPHSVESSVQSGWSSLYGYKNNNMRSGTNFVYDVYSKKYTSGGYQIVTRDFGSGSQPYLNFQGWAILFGYKKHTSTNHDTYIVAKKVAGDVGVGTTTKIYKTDHINLSATEEVEYNNQGSGVTNECSSTATNKDNQYDCNMRYDNVGFNAFLPMNDLFPNKSEQAAWDLYLVKRVDSHIVYTDLVLPFEFSDKAYNGGAINLSSGTNTSSLRMIGTDVVRRTAPRQTSVSGSTYGYFSTGGFYTRVNSDETGTGIWYAVNSSGSTRWAVTAYWSFEGSRARLSYTPPPDNAPPTHIAHSMTSTYKNGNDYWVKPNTNVTIMLRQYDPESGNKYQYLRLAGNGQDARARHNFQDTNTAYNYHWMTSPYVDITSASRKENTAYGKVEWNVVPNTHGHSYDVQYYYVDIADNTFGSNYADTGMNLRVDGEAPSHGTPTINGARYINGSTYWYRPNDSFTIRMSSYEDMSGHDRTYLRLAGSGNDNRAYHDWDDADGALTEFDNGEYTDIYAGTSPYYGWTANYDFSVKVLSNSHGGVYSVQGYYIDNVGNNSGSYKDSGQDIAVDGEVPTHDSDSITGARYVNGSTYWVKPNDTPVISLRQYDPHSGNEEQYLRLTGNGVEVKSLHDFDMASDYNNYFAQSTNVPIVAANRVENGSYGKVNWTVQPKTHGHIYDVSYYYRDNVLNQPSSYTSIGKQIGVDGVAPSIAFRNSADTADYTSQNWSLSQIQVRLKFSDPHSGYKQSRYAWTQSTATPASWSSWTTSTNYLVSKSQYGQWYLHVQAQDNVGNTITTYKGPYKFNNAPIASFNVNQSSYYVGDTMTVTSLASDPDGNALTYKYTITLPNGTTVTKTTANFTYKFPDLPGTYTVRQDVTDEHGATDWVAASVPVNNLTLKGYVKHTASWQSRHLQIGNTPLQFYSGEVFVLESDVVDHPIDRLEVDFNGYQSNGNLYTKKLLLSESTPVFYSGNFDEPLFAEGGTRLANGNVTFDFTLYYSNGIIRTDSVTVEIIGSVYDAFKFHKKY